MKNNKNKSVLEHLAKTWKHVDHQQARGDYKNLGLGHCRAGRRTARRGQEENVNKSQRAAGDPMSSFMPVPLSA